MNNLPYDGGLRRSGRTTRLVLKYVQQALDNAGSEIEIRDHHARQASHISTLMKVSAVLKALGVEHRTRPLFLRIVVIPKDSIR